MLGQSVAKSTQRLYHRPGQSHARPQTITNIKTYIRLDCIRSDFSVKDTKNLRITLCGTRGSEVIGPQEEFGGGFEVLPRDGLKYCRREPEYVLISAHLRLSDPR